MPLARVIIENYKSIKHCDIPLTELNVLIGENGTGKTNVMEAISYFYHNLTDSNIDTHVFDENNRFSNQIRIVLFYDLSEFVKISKSNSDYVPDIFGDQPAVKTKYGGYYKTIISMASRSEGKTLAVELSQIKGKTIKWNYSYEDRLVFKSLFPIFSIDTRSLDITEWGHIWDVLGELGKVSHTERKSIEAKINSILIDESKEISRKLKGISEIFSAADVDIKTATSKDFAKNLAKVFFSGEIINQSGKQLDYYSTGTNSVKYIELLLKSIDEISRTKLKEPIVLIDEPEISLHPSFIDELTDSILDVNSKLCTIISTHSSRLTKNIVTNSKTVTLYNVKLVEKYSQIQCMKMFSQYSPTSKYRVTDDHVNSYFSRAILFVEGESELELFSNPFLRLLFPALKYVDVFKAMTDKPILNIMHPRLTNTRTPYICLIDMDKAIAFSKDTKRLTLKNEYFKSNNRERFQYKNKKQNTSYVYHQRKRIDAMAQKLHVHYYKPFISSSDPYYYAFTQAVHGYLLNYNVFTFETTVEGALVNEYSFEYALDFLKKHKDEANFNSFYTYISGLPKTDRMNALRIAFRGKSDLLQSYSKKQIIPNLTEAEKLIIDKAIIGDKTSGWISEYIDDFFEDSTQIEDFSFKIFRRYLNDEEKQKTVIREFQKSFPELYELVQRVCCMIC